MSTNLLQGVLRELVEDQPVQPDRTAQVIRRYQRQKLARASVAGVAVAGVAAAAFAVGNATLSGGGTLTPGAPSVATAWDARYIPWQASLSKYNIDNEAAVSAAWKVWSGSTAAAPDTLKPIGVHTGPIDQVVFEAPNAAGELRLVSAALNGGAGVVVEDIPAPDPGTVKALAVFGQLNPDGTVRNLANVANRGAAPAATTNAMTMFVPPGTANPHMHFTAPTATVGPGITSGTFEEGVLGWLLGSDGRGPVAASQVHVTIWDGQTVLFDGGPWLQQP
jgi:hypothetical protein